MYKRIYQLLEEKGKVKSAAVIKGQGRGSRCIFFKDRCISSDGSGFDWKPFEKVIADTLDTKVVSVGDTDIFIEIYLRNPRLVILGAGHVSQPVAHIGKMLGFHVTVMDDRKDFLTRERFPDADELVIGSFEEFSEKIPLYENAYYVVITRGHKGDTICARQILKRPYAYFGMIGSKNKVRLTREKLLQEGFTEEKLNTVYSPIGLPIGGQLPEEIAISILAQIVQVKNKNYAAFTDEKVGEAVCKGRSGVMATIIKKSGSSPRGVGSKMLIVQDGKCYGSIGGGSVEYQAVKDALKVDSMQIRNYNLSINDDKNLGMICGGRVEILFERIV